MRPRRLSISFRSILTRFTLFAFAGLGALVAVRTTRATDIAPRVILLGVDEAPKGDGDGWGTPAPERAFRPDAEHGFIGGTAGHAAEAARACDGRGYPLAWREGSFRYTIRVPRGRYLVDLGFIETETEVAGDRVFDVLIEDQRAISAIDIAAEVGRFRWLVRSAVVAVDDGWIDISFVGLTPSPPRVSRIGLRALLEPSAAPRVPPIPAITARPGVGEVVVAFSPPLGPRADEGTEEARIDGFTLLRSESDGGPLLSLRALPIRSGRFRDRDVEPGRTYFYRAASLGFEGVESALSPVASAAPLSPDSFSYRHYRLLVAPVDWRRLLGAGSPRPVVPCGLEFLGQRFETSLAVELDDVCSLPDFRLDMSADTYRVFDKRRALVLESEAEDATRIREALTALAYERLGLAAARVEPILVSREDGFVGFREDVERIGRRFRRRTRLDRAGPLIHLMRTDAWQRGWEPYGTLVGEESDVVALNYFVQSVHRLNEGEISDFFTRSTYLDRWIDRLAFGALRGERDLPPEERYLLRDSRNGRWEEFRQHHRSGDWGIVSGPRVDAELFRTLSSEELERVLLPGAIVAGRASRGSELVLLTRFFAIPSFRERLCDRILELSAGALSPSAIEGMIERVGRELGPGILVDPEAWPHGDEHAFRTRLVELAVWYRAHVDALRKTIGLLRARDEEPLVIGGHLLRPRGDEKPWVELWNRSRERVELADYRLGDSFEEPGGSLAAAGEILPGARTRVLLAPRSDGAIRWHGGVLVLSRDAGAGAGVIADFAFHGWEAVGLIASRNSRDHWEYRFSGSAAEPFAGAAFPSPEFDHGLEAGADGEKMLWLRPFGNVRSPNTVEGVVVRYRTEGTVDWNDQPLAWDPDSFRWFVRMTMEDARRLEYYFLLTAANGLERAYPLGAPDVTYAIPVLPPLRINEICPRPLRESGTGEFVEIHNEGEEPVSMRGLYLTDDRRVPTKWRIEEELVLPPKAYVVFYADGRNRGRHTSFKLSNSGEYLGLYGRHEEGALRIDVASFRGVPAGQSWGRREDGIPGFRIWKDPTPGARNLPKIPEELLRKPFDGEGDGQSARDR